MNFGVYQYAGIAFTYEFHVCAHTKIYGAPFGKK